MVVLVVVICPHGRPGRRILAVLIYEFLKEESLSDEAGGDRWIELALPRYPEVELLRKGRTELALSRWLESGGDGGGVDRAGRVRMSREGRCLCVEKMDVAASSLRDDLSDKSLERLSDPLFHIQDSMGGGSEICLESKLSESFFVLLFKLSGSDSL